MKEFSSIKWHIMRVLMFVVYFVAFAEFRKYSFAVFNAGQTEAKNAMCSNVL